MREGRTRGDALRAPAVERVAIGQRNCRLGAAWAGRVYGEGLADRQSAQRVAGGRVPAVVPQAWRARGGVVKVKVQDARWEGGESGPVLPSTVARAVHVMDTSPPLPYLLAAFCRSAWLRCSSAVVPDGVSTVMLALDAKLSWEWPLAYAVNTMLRSDPLSAALLSLTPACRVTLPLPT